MVSLAKSFEKMLVKLARDLQVEYPFPDFLPLSFKDLKYLSDHPKDPVEARKWLTNLVRANPDRSEFRRISLAALEALDYGETQPIFRATRKGRKVNSIILQLQFWAIAFVRFRNAQGMIKYRARQEVGGAFGVDGNTIRSWDRRLQSEFGAIEFEKRLAYAEKDIDQSNPQQSLLEFARLYKLEKTRSKDRSQK